MAEFNTDSLYRDKVPVFGDSHCRNGTYMLTKYKDEWYMTDTYFNNKFIKITEENIDNFEFVFNFRDVKLVPDGMEDEYNVEDLYRVATNSGGWSCGHLYWTRKDVKKSPEKLIEKKLKEIESHQRSIEWLENDIVKLNNRSYCLD